MPFPAEVLTAKKTFMYSLIKEQQRGRSPSGFEPDKTRSASILNSFKNEPQVAVRISLYTDHNLYIKIISLYREY